MSHPTCASCRHLHEGAVNPGNVGQRIRECRRYPPLILLMPVPGGVTPVSVFPMTTVEVWCGEYAPRLELVRGMVPLLN